jgi:diguanylate cyclase (GGDEF)-like protein
MSRERILVVDDDQDILRVVRINLELEGFDVATAEDGQEAIDQALEEPPDLVLLDIMMPRMDGLTALRKMRSHPALAGTSIILLTARGLPEDRVRGLDLGADDYITKPFDVNELIARVKAVLRRTKAARDTSPLTGLPGNFRIGAEIEERIDRGVPFALIHCDLDNFKAFNDHYGFMRGDQVIKFCADVLRQAVADVGDESAFIGHIGGDDFVAITDATIAEQFCKAVIDRFDDGILDYYDTADALKGYIEVTDRRGERFAFPIVSISMGVVTNLNRPITSQWEASAIAVEMKEYAKKQHGSSFRIDRRTA